MAPESPPPASGPDVLAAGAVVVRRGEDGREVLLVHRPKYDDWSFPKGKHEHDEHITVTAVREVLEETGVEIRLARPLRPQLYAVSGGRLKLVQYWIGQVVGDDDVSSYEVNEEVDEVGWFRIREAKKRLTYLDDLALLEQWSELRKRTTALLVVRHAKAVKRGQWDRSDSQRPLNEVGEAQAAALAPLLLAYGVAHVVSSPSTRCVQTVLPYAEEQVLEVEQYAELSEEDHDKDRVAGLLEKVLTAPEPTLLCSHRPVLPDLFDHLDISEEPLSPAEVVVTHHRQGRVVASERHQVAP